MDEARRKITRPGEASRTPPCWRELLLDAIAVPWGTQARVEDLLDRVEGRAGR